jgi:hypothetical protein
MHLTLQAAFGFRAMAREQEFSTGLSCNLFWVCHAAGRHWCWRPGCLHARGAARRSICWARGWRGWRRCSGSPRRTARGSGISLAAWTGIRPCWGSALNSVLEPMPGATNTCCSWRARAWPWMRRARRSQKSKPMMPSVFRVAGLQRSLLGEYAGVYGMEDIRSCAPLANGDYIDLVRKFPGIKFGEEWVIEITDPVAAQPLLNLLNVKYLLTQPGSAWSRGGFPAGRTRATSTCWKTWKSGRGLFSPTG